MTEYLINRGFIKGHKDGIYRPTYECPKWCHIFQNGAVVMPVLMIGVKSDKDLRPIKITEIDDFECLEKIINRMKKTNYEQN